MRIRSYALLCLLLMLTGIRPAHAASSYDNCSGFITTLPAVVSTPGTWCLKQNVFDSVAGDTAITISSNDVVLDCNDFTINGDQTGSDTHDIGVFASGASNVRVRHCHFSWFSIGVQLQKNGSSGGHNVVEDNYFARMLDAAVVVEGDGNIVRRNQILESGESFVTTNAGVHATGQTDIADNNVVVDQCNTAPCGVGILLDTGEGSVISGNRIGGYSSFETAIQVDGVSRVAVRKNQLLGTTGTSPPSIGASCDTSGGGAAVRVRDNVFRGYVTAISGCADAGGNGVAP